MFRMLKSLEPGDSMLGALESVVCTEHYVSSVSFALICFVFISTSF